MLKKIAIVAFMCAIVTGKVFAEESKLLVNISGVGYRFSKDVRTIVYYQHKKDDTKTRADDVVYIKCGISF